MLSPRPVQHNRRPPSLMAMTAIPLTGRESVWTTGERCGLSARTAAPTRRTVMYIMNSQYSEGEAATRITSLSFVPPVMQSDTRI